MVKVIKEFDDKDSKTLSFIENAKKIHGNKYDYSKVRYIKSSLKVKVVCTIHGEFEQTPNCHLSGSGCKKCGIDKSAKNKFYDKEKFINLAIKKHKNFYSYDNILYKGCKVPVLIICPIHGNFEQAPINHLAGKGCSKCGGSKKLTTEDFVERANILHKNKYEYSLVKYKNIDTNVEIICPIHGNFKQTPWNHLHSGGCGKCRSYGTSFPEQILFFYLKLANLYILNREKVKGIEVDLYIPELNLALEYDGLYYHQKRKKQDRSKATKLKEIGIDLIRIREKGLAKIDQCFNILRNSSKHEDLETVLNEISKIIFLKHNFKISYDFNLDRDTIKILEFIKGNTIKNSLSELHPDIAKQWHHTKNGNLKPEQFSYGSEYKIWWVCENDHTYKTSISKRTSGKGCYLCGRKEVGNKLRHSIDHFIKKSNERHKNFYDYSKVIYVSTDSKVIITCPIHGDFLQSPYIHLRSQGCTKCSGNRKLSNEDFENKAKEIHGNKYDYSRVEYKNAHTKVKIICFKHGEFNQIPNAHTRGQGCPVCGNEQRKFTKKYQCNK